MKGILGTKIGMTQVWKNDRAVPVTVILAGPCPVVQRRTPDKDGYEAVQLGFRPQKAQRVNKPLKGHFAKAGVCLFIHISEPTRRRGISYAVFCLKKKKKK